MSWKLNDLYTVRVTATDGNTKQMAHPHGNTKHLCITSVFSVNVKLGVSLAVPLSCVAVLTIFLV